MQYYVIGPDGNKYGPADVNALKGWVAENRLGPTSMVEDFNTGQRMQASQIPGLFGDAPQPGAPQMGAPTMGSAAPGGAPSQPYVPGVKQMAADDGKNLVIWAWVLSSVGFVICCLPFHVSQLI